MNTGDGDRLGRDTALITGLTAISRITGFARVIVSAAVLGTGLLGDVYQSANTVPNIVFELLAGGALQAALVPVFVGVRRRGDEAAFARTVGLVGATVVAALAVASVVLMVVSPLVARVLMSAEPVPIVADDKVALATWMLIVFAPQIVFYGLGLVSSAALQARRRFAAAAIAPAINNLVVIVTYLVFDAMRDGSGSELVLSAGEIAVLAGGTTLAVVAFTSVPLVALARSTDQAFAPRVAFTDPVVASVARTGGWAVIQVAGALVLTAGALVVGNGAPGGVAVFALALAVFLLPHALIAAPAATAAMPRLAHLHQEGDAAGFRALVRVSVTRVSAMSLLASVGLAVLAWPLARVVVFGAADERGPAPVAHALLAFAIGVLPYGLHVLLTRVLMSRGDVRAAAGVSMLTAAVGVVLMAVVAGAVDDSERATALALAYSVAHLVGVLVLGPLLALRLRRPLIPTTSGDASDTVLELLGPSTGGIRRHVTALADDLSGLGWRVTVAAPAGVVDGAEKVTVPGGVSWVGLRRARAQLAALVADRSPAVVHAHGLKAGWVAIGVPGPRTVLTVHNVVLGGGARGAGLRLLERHVVGSVDTVIATSREIADRLAGVARHLVVVPPSHDVDPVRRRRDDVRAELGVAGPLVVTVARLHRQKSVATLLEATSRLGERHDDVTLVVVGDGPERDDLERLAAAGPAAVRVRFLGERRDAVDLMAAADVVVISSSWESGPLTLLEAGAVAAPLVSTPVGFVPDIVSDGTEGLLVPIGDATAMAEAIASLLDRPTEARAMGEALRRAVAPRLDHADAARAIAEVYRVDSIRQESLS